MVQGGAGQLPSLGETALGFPLTFSLYVNLPRLHKNITYRCMGKTKQATATQAKFPSPHSRTQKTVQSPLAWPSHHSLSLTPVYSHPTINIQAYTTNTLNNQRSKLVEMVERYKATDFQAELSYRYLFRMMSQLDFAFISHNDKGVGFWNERTKSYYSECGHIYLSVRTLVMLLHPPRTVDCIFTAMFGLWMLCRICTQPCCPCSSSETLAL